MKQLLYFIFVVTDEENCLRRLNCTLEEYIVDNDMIHQLYANMLDIQEVFREDFPLLKEFPEEWVRQLQYLELLPYVVLPFRPSLLLGTDSTDYHPKCDEYNIMSLLFLRFKQNISLLLNRFWISMPNTFEEPGLIYGSLCRASCSLQQNQTSGRHVLHRVEEIVLQRKHGPSINGRGDTESDLLFCSPPSEISKRY